MVFHMAVKKAKAKQSTTRKASTSAKKSTNKAQVKPAVDFRIDKRGFLLLRSAAVQKYKFTEYPFVDIYYDKTSKTVELHLSKKEKVGSFRVLNFDGRYAIHLAGVLNTAKIGIKVGEYTFNKNGSKLQIKFGKGQKTGTMVHHACRNSAGMPMASLDKRALLIFDKNATKEYNIVKNPFIQIHYDKKKQSLGFEFTKSKKLKVKARPVDRHVNISLMGTLSNLGLERPQNTVRMQCKQDKKGIVWLQLKS